MVKLLDVTVNIKGYYIMHDKKMLDIFRIPAYSFKFKNHNKFKENWIKFIDEYDYKTKDKHFLITDANLHKKELFNPLRVFFLECLYSVTSDLGFHCDMGITSMWATKHLHDNHHHSHIHGNTLFAAVYYLHSDTENVSSTVFQNPISDLITMVKMHKTSSKISSSYNYEYSEKFEEGKLVIFPGWLRHYVNNNNGENRQIIGFNSMPIGITTSDPFDRYNYHDFRNEKMFGDVE